MTVEELTNFGDFNHFDDPCLYVKFEFKELGHGLTIVLTVHSMNALAAMKYKCFFKGWWKEIMVNHF